MGEAALGDELRQHFMSLNATGTLVKLFRERSKPTASRGVALSTGVRPDRKGDGGVACCRPDDGGDLKSAGGAIGKNPTLVRLRKSNGDGECSTNCDGNVVGLSLIHISEPTRPY